MRASVGQRPLRTTIVVLISFNRIMEWKLFDLEKDPREMKSQYGSAEYADVQRDLETRRAEGPVWG